MEATHALCPEKSPVTAGKTNRLRSDFTPVPFMICPFDRATKLIIKFISNYKLFISNLLITKKGIRINLKMYDITKKH